MHWTDTSLGQILPISYVDDVVTACWSQPHGVYVTFAKHATAVMGRTRRTIWTSTSRDIVHWSKAQPALVADRRDDLGSRIRASLVRPLLNYPDNPNVMRTEIYGSGAYSAESCLVAFPWVFTATANALGNQEGPLETQIAVSHDLETWQGPFRTPAIPLGEPGDFDCGMLTCFSYAFDYEDEVRMYYWAASFTHTPPRANPDGGTNDVRFKLHTGIGLATWPKERFVSADGPPGGPR